MYFYLLAVFLVLIPYAHADMHGQLIQLEHKLHTLLQALQPSMPSRPPIAAQSVPIKTRLPAMQDINDTMKQFIEYPLFFENKQLAERMRIINQTMNSIALWLPSFEHNLIKFANEISSNTEKKIDEPISFSELVCSMKNYLASETFNSLKQKLKALIIFKKDNKISAKDTKTVRKYLELCSDLLQQWYKAVETWYSDNFITLIKYRWQSKNFEINNSSNEANAQTWFTRYLYYQLQDEAKLQDSSAEHQQDSLNALLPAAIKVFSK